MAARSLPKSQILNHELPILAVSVSKQCICGLLKCPTQSIDFVSDGLYNFVLQVSGIMMNEYVGDDITEKLHEEQWLTQFQATAHTGTDRAAAANTSSSSSSRSSASTEKSSGGGKEIKAEVADGADAAAVTAKTGGEQAGDRRRLLAVLRGVTSRLKAVW